MIDIKDIQNFIDVVAVAPTHTPRTFWDQIKFCSADSKFYIYDFKNGTWNGISGNSDAVLLTGDQTIAGVKTFSLIPVLPAEDATDDNQAIRKAQLDATESAANSYADTQDLKRLVVIASDNLKASADTERSRGGGWDIVKAIRVKYDGVVRVKFDYKNSGTTAQAAIVLSKQTYATWNGVAASQPDRTVESFSTNSASYITATADIAVNFNDVIQLYFQQYDSGSAQVRNFRIYYDKQLITTDYEVVTD